MKTLKTRLSDGVKGVYLLTGDDFYLFEKGKEMIKKACNITMPDINVASFDDDNFSVKSFLDNCQVFPIGDNFRIIVLNGITKISESDKKEILKYAQKPVDGTVVIIMDYQNKFDFLQNYVEVVDTKRMDRSILVKIVVGELNKAGKKISSEAADALIEACNSYLTKITNELVKLIYFSDEQELITKAMVDEIVIKDTEYTIFELTDALSKKNGDKALKLLSLMENDQGVLSLITNHFRRLFFISITDMSDKELSNYLGVKEYAITKARTQLKGFSKVQLRKINKLLEEVDYSIKSGKMQAGNALYFLVFNILYV